MSRHFVDSVGTLSTVAVEGKGPLLLAIEAFHYIRYVTDVHNVAMELNRAPKKSVPRRNNPASSP